MNKLAEALNSGRFVVTGEILPPPGSDADAIRKLSSMLPANLDAVVIADNPDRIRSSAFSAAAILRKERQSSIVLSMATRDRNRIALMSDALGAAALGIDAVLCMSGNHQSIGVCPQAAAAYDIDSTQFAQAMKKLVLHGSGLNGRELEPRFELQVGAVAHPYLRPMDLNLLRLRKKIMAGTDFFLTQAVFDLEGFEQWMYAVRSAGLDSRTAIIPSVLPLASVEEGKTLQQNQTYGPIADDVIARIGNAADPEKEGAAIAAEIAIRLSDLSGVRGIHILSGGCEALAAAVIEQADILVARQSISAFAQRNSLAAKVQVCLPATD